MVVANAASTIHHKWQALLAMRFRDVQRGSPLTLLLISLAIAGCSKQQADVEQTVPQQADAESIARADQLAAHPADSSKPKNVTGVTDEQLQAGDALEKAASACMDAVEKNPDEPRYLFELGRVLVLGGLVDEGREQLAAAANHGHGGAYFYLAQLEEDLDKVHDLLEKASAAGFKPADEMLAQLADSPSASEPSTDSDLSTSTSDAMPLRDQQIITLQWSMVGRIADIPVESRDSVVSQVEQIIHSGQKVLVCSYGTSETDKKTYRFWHQTTPANLETIIQGVAKHPLRALPLKPCATPPASWEEAERIENEGRAPAHK